MENSKIQWTDHTFNPWRICSKVSEGCRNCYAAELSHRFGWGDYADHVERQRTSPMVWSFVERLNAKAAKLSTQSPLSSQPKVFCGSLCDWLDPRVPIAWLVDLLNLIDATPHITWQLLTKRPEQWAMRIAQAAHYSPLANRWLNSSGVFVGLDHPPENVWFGVTAENQARANERIPLLLDIPAAKRFLSVEPMLGPVDLGDVQGLDVLNGLVSTEVCHQVDWVIFGGESGNQARECDIMWIYEGVRQCQRANVPVFVKQLGRRSICLNANLLDWPDHVPLFAHGEGAAGCRPQLSDPKGGNLADFPTELQVRQFPMARSRSISSPHPRSFCHPVPMS
ncbi:MAG: DUF5131 family protein [Rhodospirillaceae bacterium]